MCDLVTMIGAALSVATTVTEFKGAAEETKQHNQMVAQNQEAAQANLRREYAATQTRQLQEEDAAAVEKSVISKEARAARASAMVASGEAGVSGLSVDALIADIYGAEATQKDRVTQNTGFTTQNLSAEMDGLKAKALDRINSVPYKNGPSPLASALKIGVTGLNSFKTGQARKTA